MKNKLSSPARVAHGVDTPALIPMRGKRSTRKATREARATTLARKAQRAMKYGGK